VSKFMQMYGDQDLFPVKIQIPLVLSMRITVNVKNICVWGSDGKAARATCKNAPASMQCPPQPAFFVPPEGYEAVTLEEVGNEKRKKQRQRRASRLHVAQHQHTAEAVSGNNSGEAGAAARAGATGNASS
jgi:hypothetical protein